MIHELRSDTVSLFKERLALPSRETIYLVCEHPTLALSIDNGDFGTHRTGREVWHISSHTEIGVLSSIHPDLYPGRGGLYRYIGLHQWSFDHPNVSTMNEHGLVPSSHPWFKAYMIPEVVIPGERKSEHEPSVYVPVWYRRKDKPEYHVEAMRFDGSRECADRIVEWLKDKGTDLAGISYPDDPPHWCLSLNPDIDGYRVLPEFIVAFNYDDLYRVMMVNPAKFADTYEPVETEPTEGATSHEHG